MDVFGVCYGRYGIGELVRDLLMEADNGTVVSFSHKGQKKKGIVVGTKGEHLVVARGGDRHLVKHGQSQRMMEASEDVDDPVAILDGMRSESIGHSELDLLVEAITDGAVDLTSPMVVERLTPRQLKFLFATGAFAAGKAAAKAVAGSNVGPSKREAGSYLKTSPTGSIKRVMPAARAAAKQAMQQQLTVYRGLKKANLLRARGALSAGTFTPGLSVARKVSREYARSFVK